MSEPCQSIDQRHFSLVNDLAIDADVGPVFRRKPLRRAADRFITPCANTLLDLRHAEHPGEIRADLVDDVARAAARREYAYPAGEFVAGKSRLRYRGYLRHRRNSSGTGDGQRPKLSGFDLRQSDR